MNTESNGASFGDVPQPEYFQKFLVGQNLVDSSTSFARLNSKTVTERSIRESFWEEQNYEVILQQMLASNIRLMDEIAKCQNLETQVQQLQRKNSELATQIQHLQDTNAKLLHELDSCKKDKQTLQEEIKKMERENKKLYLPESKFKYNNLMDLNKILMNKTESSFQFYKDHLLSSKFTSPKIHNSNPFIYTTRPQSPSTSVRQSTPTKSEIKSPFLVFNNTANSWRDSQQNRNAVEFKKFQKTMEQLMRKPKKIT
ncbi:unnamed protein product (macronuclear) [Paramecium tetraurelia]|uniref:Uncharacterized protein n=1 Tax=Paramecium tetraurelia TaxID=5888 RepID=A0C7G3_PARTE|nr:uncharacterized protein GSPATT00035860001 [Paramecium tetraurelia]CAK66730.1 unnamed protein product [Paramecium tetraurelia]|eukprot:XP_001434127.1 hypothetical protein (macronuclear) [Paramecium tetraurelia strain d4-2]